VVSRKQTKNTGTRFPVTALYKGKINAPVIHAAEFFGDAEVRYGLSDERVRAWHVAHILGCP
jgi:hypothetical protein